MKLTFAVFLIIVLASCSTRHQLMQGTVAMKLSDRVAHVCLGNNDVKEGDHVGLYENVCPTKGQVCKKEYRGKGVITKVLNEHYSEVTLDSPAKFNEGTFVETVR